MTNRPRNFATLATSCGAAVPLLVLASLCIAACGARGPLDDGPLNAGTADAAPVEVVDAAPAVPEAAPPVDAGPQGGSIIACGSCLVGKCSQGILQCVQDTACRATFQCVVTDCLSSGSPDPACLFKCASGDAKGALKIFTIFQCVTATCGGDCGSVLSGLLGGWDDANLAEANKAIALTRFAKPFAALLQSCAVAGCRLSPLHNRFPIDLAEGAARESAELMEERRLTARRLIAELS